MKCKAIASPISATLRNMLCVLMCLVFVLGFTVTCYARLPMNQFGKNWVRTHKFQIMNGSTIYPIEWNNMQDLCTSGYVSGGSGLYESWIYGITKHTNFWVNARDIDQYGNVNSEDQGIVAALSTPNDNDAWYLSDEPVSSDIPANAVYADWLKACRPNGLIYVNVCKEAEDIGDPVLTGVLSTVQPDILMGDCYPYFKIISIANAKSNGDGAWVRCAGYVSAKFGTYFYIEEADQSDNVRVVESDAGLVIGQEVTVVGQMGTLESQERCINATDVIGYRTGEDPGYFPTIKKWRDKAIENGIPYFAWVQSFEDFSDGGWVEPSESEMRMNVWSHLTMGYKGIAWFFYDQVNPENPAGTNWLVDEVTRQPRPSYYWSRSINSEIEKQGKYLRFLNNTDVRFVPNVGNPTAKGLSNWSSGAGGDNYIQSIYLEYHQPTLDKQDALIGFFTDDSGQRYFMIQNLWRDPGQSAWSRSAAISIYFGSSTLPVPGKVYRLDRTTGQSVEVTLNQATLNVYPPGGTAELFSYQPFSLVGKDTVLPNGSISINSGAATTNSTSVTLSLNATDDSSVSQMRFSNNWSTWSSWETYATSKAWTLASGDGDKIVYVQYKDEAGNVRALAARICLISSTGVTINAGSSYSDSSVVTLYLKGTSGATQMQFSDDNTDWSKPAEPYATTRAGYTLSSGNGSRTVYVRFYNGSWSGSYSDSITVSAQTPYSGSPISIPGRIEAEYFDNGGEGIAYHDNDSTNQGNIFRTDQGVDIQTCTEGGYNVSWTNSGEWLEYKVNVTSSGYYDVGFRIASASYNSAFHLEVDGVNVTGTRGCAATAGWQTWNTETVPCIYLSSGQHTVRLFSYGDMNINYIDITSTSRTPYSLLEYQAPCVIQAESYCSGGQGISYSDYDSSNRGGCYRIYDGVDIEQCSQGGSYNQNVCYMVNGEWLTWIVNVPAEANYRVRARVAGPPGGYTQQYSISVGSRNSGTRQVTTPGGFQNFTTHETVMWLMPGRQVLRFNCLSGVDGVYSGNNSVWNLDYIEIAPY